MERYDYIVFKARVSKYERLFEFKEDLGMVIYNNKFGFINKEGYEVIKPEYDDARSFKEGRAAVKKANKWFFINKYNEKVSSDYDFIRDYQDGYAIVRIKNKYGMIDSLGMRVLNIKYDSIEYLSDGLILVRENGIFKYITLKGEVVIELPQYVMMAYPFKNGVARITKDDAKKYFINKKGEKITEPIYDSVSDFEGDLASVWVSMEGSTIIYRNGEELFPRTTNFVINECVSKKGIFKATFGYHKQALIDRFGNFITNKFYQEIYNVSDGVIRVRDEKGYYGFIDSNGKEIIPCILEYALDFQEGAAVIKENDRYGFINKGGFIIIPCIYDHASSFSNNLALLELDNQEFYVDKNNKPLNIKETKEKILEIQIPSVIPPYVLNRDIEESFISYKTKIKTEIEEVITTSDINGYKDHIQKVDSKIDEIESHKVLRKK